MPVERLADFVGKDQVIRLTKVLVARPHSLHCRKNDTMFIERHLTLAGFGLHIIELVVINTFVYNNAIAKDVFLSQCESFTGTHGSEGDQHDHRLRRFLHRFDHPADVRQRKKHGRLHSPLSRQLHANSWILVKHAPRFTLVQCSAERAVYQPNRLRREAGRQRVEEFLDIHGGQFANLT